MFATKKGLEKLAFSNVLMRNLHKTSRLRRYPAAHELKLQKEFLEDVGDLPTGKKVNFSAGDRVYGFGSANFPSTSFWKEGGVDHPVLMNAINFKAVFACKQKRDASPKRLTPKNNEDSRVQYASKYHSPMMFKVRSDTAGIEVSDGGVYVLDDELDFVLPSGEESTSLGDESDRLSI